MNIRGEVQLIDFIASNKQRRKRELISFKQDLVSHNVSKRVIRSSIVIAYAHWEGFVKEAARAYVQLVCNKSRGFASLSLNFQALVCRQELRIAQQAAKRVSAHIALVELLLNNNISSVTIDEKSAIDTESNLRADIFENICLSIGISYKILWLHEGPFINDLFENRCAIAHGELQEPESKYAIEVVDKVLQWIENFSSDIENAALEKAYLRPQAI